MLKKVKGGCAIVNTELEAIGNHSNMEQADSDEEETRSSFQEDEEELDKTRTFLLALQVSDRVSGDHRNSLVNLTPRCPLRFISSRFLLLKTILKLLDAFELSFLHSAPPVLLNFPFFYFTTLINGIMSVNETLSSLPLIISRTCLLRRSS